MRTALSFVIPVLVTTMFAFTWAVAQEGDQPQPISGRVLEVTHTAAGPSRITLREGVFTGFWTPAMPRLRGWKPGPDAVPVQAVNFQARLLPGDKAEVKISIFTGTKRFREEETVIGSYTVAEGETVIAAELAKYGFEPLPMRMLAVAQGMSTLPTVNNRSTSISAIASPMIATRPSFTVKLVNNGSKDVAAIIWHTQTGDHMLYSSIAANRYAEVMIEAGGARSSNYPGNERGTGDGSVTLYIDAVIFQDGTFEGDEQSAANFAAMVMGRRNALNRAMGQIKSALDTKRPDVAKLIALIDADNDELPTESLTSFRNRFPNDLRKDSRTDARVKAATDSVKNEILAALRRVDGQQAGRSDSDIALVLNELRTFFQDWLERLPKLP